MYPEKEQPRGPTWLRDVRPDAEAGHRPPRDPDTGQDRSDILKDYQRASPEKRIEQKKAAGAAKAVEAHEAEKSLDGMDRSIGGAASFHRDFAPLQSTGGD